MKKSNVKYTERKPTASTSRGMDKVTISTDEELGEESCSSGEENFSTLTSYDGQEQYRLPDKTRKEARFGAKRQEPAAEDFIQVTMWSLKDQFSKVTKKISEQETIIQKLKLSNAANKKKLLELGDVPGTVSTTKKKNVPKEGRLRIKLLQDCDEWVISNQGFMPAGPSNLNGFVSTQLRHEIEGTDDIVVLDDPDSTPSGTKMKKTTKRLEEIDKDSNASEVLSHSQRPKKRHRISSNRSSAPYKLLSPNAQQSGEETGDEVNRLLNERDEVAEKLLEMQRKMEGLEWAEQACVYQATIEKSVVLFRLALLNNFDNKEGQEVVDAQGDNEQVTMTLQQNGFALQVCENFVDHVEKTVCVGFIPEQKMSMTVADNSGDDPVQGYMRDVTYTLDIPVVVKQEKVEKDDDDLLIVGITPATKNIVDMQKVKTTPPSSPQKGTTGETGTSPQKNMTEDNPTTPNKDATEDSVMSLQKDVTEDTPASPQKSSTPQKVKPKPQKSLGTTNTRTLRSQVHKRN